MLPGGSMGSGHVWEFFISVKNHKIADNSTMAEAKK
jgi:hypothetical protein